MYTFIIVLSIIVCVALTFIVLIQNPKGGGIASSFSAGNQIMGVKRTNELVEKVTWGLAIALLVLALSSNLFISGSSDAVQESVIQEQIDAGDLPESAPSSLPTGPLQGNPGGPGQGGPAGGDQGQPAPQDIPANP